jgi:hypothetical protein
MVTDVDGQQERERLRGGHALLLLRRDDRFGTDPVG